MVGGLTGEADPCGAATAGLAACLAAIPDTRQARGARYAQGPLLAL